jgi:hypothetical protein
VNISKGRILETARGGLGVFRTKKWVRVVTYSFVAVTLFSVGVQQGARDADPNKGTGPGNTVEITDLKGKWDGIGVMPDGTPFCVVGWPCEDGFLEDK